MTETGTKHEALYGVYCTINGPVQAGPVWVKYNRKNIDAVLDVLRQLLEAEGCEFRSIE